jgi:hypothetical protein
MTKEPQLTETEQKTFDFLFFRLYPAWKGNTDSLACFCYKMVRGNPNLKGFLMKKAYGHGWMVRNGTSALCLAKPYNPKSMSKDIGIIRELGRIGDRFGIETYCEQIAWILQGILESGKIPDKEIVVKGGLGKWIM